MAQQYPLYRTAALEITGCTRYAPPLVCHGYLRGPHRTHSFRHQWREDSPYDHRLCAAGAASAWYPYLESTVDPLRGLLPARWLYHWRSFARGAYQSHPACRLERREKDAF